jgi:hypothetical protein
MRETGKTMTAETSNALGVVDDAMVERFIAAIPEPYCHDCPPPSAIRAGLTAALTAEQQGQAVATVQLNPMRGKDDPHKIAYLDADLPVGTNLYAQPMQQGGGEGCQWAHEVVVRGQSAATSSGTGCAATGGRCVPGSAPPSAPVGVDYAKRLATALWQQHYREDAPQWEPFDDLMGLLSQIDNMISGLTRADALAQQPAAVDEARPLDEWHEDDGPVVWWKFPVDDPAWIGTPLDSDWPGYHTHWTPHPAAPALATQHQEEG